MSKGLYDKYIVTKADGSPPDPDARYFILRIDTDRCARLALRTYARAIEWENKELAHDLFQLLKDVQTKQIEQMKKLHSTMTPDTDYHGVDVRKQS